MARILMIDDDASILDLEKKILSNEGHDVLVVEDALEALDILKLYKVDLMIVDIEMPRVNGFQFVTTIRNNPELTHIPIAFLSAHGESETISKAAKLGADFYLLKPIEPKSFVAKITAFLGQKILNKHPKIEFKVPISTDVKLHLVANLLEISDIGVKIITSEELMEGQTIELSSVAFNGLFSENPVFKVSCVKPYRAMYEATLLFTDHHVEVVRKVQRYILNKSEVLKYSKAK